MEKVEIIKNGILYALLCTGKGFNQGLDFLTKDKDFLQAATWNYRKGRQLGPHSHLLCERQVNLTQEFIYVKEGSLAATFYDKNDRIISKHILRAGDFALFFAGGHGYLILEDDTEVIEIKNGPYAGPEKDRKRIAAAESAQKR